MPHRKRVSDPMTQLTLKTVIKWSPSGSLSIYKLQHQLTNNILNIIFPQYMIEKDTVKWLTG